MRGERRHVTVASSPKQSTPMQVATATLQHATESLSRAEEDLRNWRTANPQDFTSAGFLALSAEVTRCTAVLAGAQQTLQALAAHFPLNKQKMSTPMQVATATLQHATESLSRAEDRLNAYLEGTLNLPPGVTYQELSAEVTRCTAVLAGAQQTLQALAAQSATLSSLSSASSISCKSQSITGHCSTGRHTDRNKGIQKTFKRKLVKRDTCCIATGVMEGSVAAHIIPLNKSELIPRDMLFSPRNGKKKDMLFSPRNGVLLHEALEDDYNRHMWFFDYDGNVTVLYSKWIHRNTIRRVNVSKDPETGPSKEHIELRNQLALEQKQHYCPYCWKYVGAVNIENHAAGRCEGIDKMGDENEDIDDNDDN